MWLFRTETNPPLLEGEFPQKFAMGSFISSEVLQTWLVLWCGRMVARKDCCRIAPRPSILSSECSQGPNLKRVFLRTSLTHHLGTVVLQIRGGFHLSFLKGKLQRKDLQWHKAREERPYKNKRCKEGSPTPDEG